MWSRSTEWFRRGSDGFASFAAYGTPALIQGPALLDGGKAAGSRIKSAMTVA